MTALFAENLINDGIQYSLFLHVINGADKVLPFYYKAHYYKSHIEWIVFHGFCFTDQEIQVEQC